MHPNLFLGVKQQNFAQALVGSKQKPLLNYTGKLQNSLLTAPYSIPTKLRTLKSTMLPRHNNQQKNRFIREFF
jgi:hypothetical protein